MKALEPLRGGTPSARRKLNELADAVNALRKLCGDKYISVQHTSAGVGIGLNLDALLERIPHGLRFGLCQIDSNDGGGAYTVTQLIWEPGAPGYHVATSTGEGLYNQSARDMGNRATAVAGSTPVFFWQQKTKGSTTEVVIDIGCEEEAIGSIKGWALGALTIPVGWALCDGTSGTVDLRARFVVGYDPRTGGSIPAYGDAAYQTPGNTGGAKAHTHADHTVDPPCTYTDCLQAGPDIWDAWGHGEFDTLKHDSPDHRPPWYVFVWIQKIS